MKGKVHTEGDGQEADGKAAQASVCKPRQAGYVEPGRISGVIWLGQLGAVSNGGNKAWLTPSCVFSSMSNRKVNN